MHERTIRELKFENGAIRIGEPIIDFFGVLSGTPQRASGAGWGRRSKPREEAI
jgi:hypothetical protein